MNASLFAVCWRGRRSGRSGRGASLPFGVAVSRCRAALRHHGKTHDHWIESDDVPDSRVMLAESVRKHEPQSTAV